MAMTDHSLSLSEADNQSNSYWVDVYAWVTSVTDTSAELGRVVQEQKFQQCYSTTGPCPTYSRALQHNNRGRDSGIPILVYTFQKARKIFTTYKGSRQTPSTTHSLALTLPPKQKTDTELES